MSEKTTSEKDDENIVIETGNITMRDLKILSGILGGKPKRYEDDEI